MFGTKFSKNFQNKNAAWYCSINYSDWQQQQKKKVKSTTAIGKSK